MKDIPHEDNSWFEKITDLFHHEPKNRKELLKVLDDAQERKLFSHEISHMIKCVIEMSEMQVREIMVAKSQMVAFNIDSNLETVLPIVIESGHSRFPVLDSNNNEVCGILLAKDLLQHFTQYKPVFEMKTLLRQAVFIPQSKRLDILLKEFRLNRNHIAMVIDEYGFIAGLVTIEDVLEQIVGDIEDEYDVDEEDPIKKVSDHVFHVNATTAIDDFNKQFTTQFSDEEYDTIGGLVLHGFAHLPKRGEKITLENIQFKVLQSDNRRIHLLEVTPSIP
jgi:magnesium and cobalt transporter